MNTVAFRSCVTTTLPCPRMSATRRSPSDRASDRPMSLVVTNRSVSPNSSGYGWQFGSAFQSA